MTDDLQAELAKNELWILPIVIKAQVFYTITYILCIVHKELSCKTKQIQDGLKTDPVIYFIDALTARWSKFRTV